MLEVLVALGSKQGDTGPSAIIYWVFRLNLGGLDST